MLKRLLLNQRLRRKSGACMPKASLKKGLLLFFVALWLLGLAFPAPAEAQAAIQVLATSAKADYPASITFRIQAQSSANITKLALRYKLDRLTCVSSVVSEAWPEFTPATKVDTSWVWQMKKTGGLPPGAKLEYSWLIEDAQGRRLETSPANLAFDDTRFPWQNVKDGLITLYWYEGNQNFAQRLLSAGQGALQRMATETGTKLDRPVRIYIYNSSEALQSARVFAPTWEGGVAFPDYSILAIGVNLASVAWGETTVAHELTHVLTNQLTQSCYGGIPTWLSEGLSTYAEGELETSQQRRLQRAISDNSIFSVHTLSGPFPAQTDLALLSYAQSYSVVKFLIDKFGGAKIVAFQTAFKEGLTDDEALNKIYNLDTDKLDVQWRASVGAPPRPVATPATAPTVTPRPATPSPAVTAAPTPPVSTPAASTATPRPATPPLPVAPTPVAPTPPPALTPAPTLASVPTPAPTPAASKGFLGCRAAPATSSAPVHKPEWGSGMLAFGFVAFGLTLFGWIKRGRR